MELWQLTDFHRFGFDGLVFFSREQGELKALEVALEKHQFTLKENIGEANLKRDSIYDEEEKSWWLSRPKMTIARLKERTWFGCGSPDWCSRDRRGASYGFVTILRVNTDKPTAKDSARLSKACEEHEYTNDEQDN